MSRAERRSLIDRLQTARGGRLLITYITSTRPGYEIQMSDDACRVIYDHLEAGKALAANGVDLFIHSNGGSGTVPWRLVNLIRQYSTDFVVLVPHAAFSAATLVALGAREILMHKMGCLGPIDPSVTNLFNPPHPTSPGQFAPISVEDVSAYLKFVKEDAGVTHEDELIQAIIALTEKIHPLAIGNVQRQNNQSRMMARKLLSLHMKQSEQHEIEQLIDILKSNLFFHGHPINRVEAEKDLQLKVKVPSPDVESLMWELYLAYERDLKLKDQFLILRELEAKQPSGGAPPQALTVDQVVAQMQALAQRGIQLPAVSEEQLVRLAAATAQVLAAPPGSAAQTKVVLDPIPGAYVESVAQAHVFKTKLRVERSTANLQAGPQEVVKHEVIGQGWEEET